MQPLLNEFLRDLERMKNLVNLIEELNQFTKINSIKYSGDLAEDHFLKTSLKIHEDARNSKTGLTILPGTLLLYLGGRFENFVKSIFEELCAKISSICKTYKNLPKAMRDNIIKYTAEVISNPRKYGHAENGVASFIKNLNININENDVSVINSSCLSITYENMRPDTLNELFERIGAKNIWETISNESRMRLFLGTHDPNQAKTRARKYLNEFIDIRNKVAHPSTDITWPEINVVVTYINFFEELAFSITQFTELYVIQVRNNLQGESVVNS